MVIIMIANKVVSLTNVGLTIFVAALSTGCATKNLPSLVCEPEFEQKISNLTPEHKELAASHYEYAILSNNVYRDLWQSKGAPNSESSQDSGFGIPELWFDTNKWQPVCAEKVDNAYGKNVCRPEKFHRKNLFGIKSGFFAQTFDKKSDYEGQLPDLVLVFSGTDGLDDVLTGDFGSIQHTEAEEYAIRELEKYKERHQASSYPKLIAVGHSLGGALAQHLAYCIDGTYAIGFNSSPLVFSTACQGSIKMSNSDAWKNITLLHQKGELLNPLRNFFKSIGFLSTQKDPPDVAYNLVSGNPLQRHKMVHLAVGLTKVVKCDSTIESPVKARAEEVLKQSCTLNAFPACSEGIRLVKE